MIPKIIHYCWYGEQKVNDDIKKCMKSWDLCENYKIMKWDDSNSNFSANDFVLQMYKKKLWAFVSDFFRLKALYDYGGIYLDTDVELQRSFDDLLNNHLFFGFIFDSSVGTAVIGCEKENHIIGELLELYKSAKWNDSKKGFEVKEFPNVTFYNNNNLITYYLKNRYNDFLLNGKLQRNNDFVIFTKEEFEIGPIFGKKHSIHRALGSWKKDKNSFKKVFNRKVKRGLSDIKIINAESLLRHVTYKLKLPHEAFYNIYMNDRKKK
ncbi:glycosyltransferase family 32 protein [Limosilactobacillus reuteri subsp. suis]|uniref:glycosyltransferase family 32 protein n=1 Tax=Limosilactobacillus reuteri TaxID=1598 RepID=UPI00399221D4